MSHAPFRALRCIALLSPMLVLFCVSDMQRAQAQSERVASLRWVSLT